MSVEWRGLPAKYEQGALIIAGHHGADAVAATVTVEQAETGLTLTRNGEYGHITYGTVHDLMRAITLWLGHAQTETTFDLHEESAFTEVGAMIDLARNGVLSMPEWHRTIEKLASLGYTEAWMYLEDCFEVPEEPYFGLQRGRYSQADLHELALYADQFGLVMVPAIQTLAHLQNALKWTAFQDIKDTPEVLWVEKPETTEFLRHLLKAASAPFLTKKIHIGMDEAYGLGTGDRLIKVGYEDQLSLLSKHIKTVDGLCRELHLRPYMWSDFWFTAASRKHEMYDETVHFSKEFADAMPDVGQAYWDYYHEDVQTYVTRLKQHFELKKPVVYAGGLWTWGGMAPHQQKMLQSVRAGMTGSRETGVKEVVATMWFDDGAETPFESAWLGLQTFVEYAYHETVSDADLARQFKLMQGEDMASYMLLDEFDHIEPNPDNLSAENPSKIVLYEDLFLQRYQVNLKPFDLVGHYSKLALALATTPTSPASQPLFAYFKALATADAAKARALQAVASLDLAGENRDADPAIAAIAGFKQALDMLQPLARIVWHNERRGQGYEILDIRLGGQASRADTVIWRLQQWELGQDDLAELAEPKLPMDKWTSGPIGHGLYKQIVSADMISF
ncbi:family 20 glycosylhydrolase [Lacticaseibacillus mingshuiensis]|uniref:family 20 glycosylhydrolase n=1 Tax=Lacticaseibacillus mingshuiensis TaxID=2799574 RepID=UPI0019507130|nr:family 20 glycosylhydrolase [Lacticaseibacillus mingshuiensis]